MIRKMLTRALLGACAMLGATSAQAQDFYYGQIITVGFTYCPENTLEANGQTVSSSTYAALYALYGTTYGGNSSYFALPDLRGRVQIGQGTGTGLSAMTQGGTGGQESVTLSTSQMPQHTHTATLNGSTGSPASGTPGGNALASFGANPIYATSTPSSAMNASSISVGTAGGTTATPVRDPYLVLRYCVVTNGYWPTHP